MTGNGTPLVTAQLYETVRQAIEAGWSINRLAEEAGISRPSLQRWYSGNRASLSDTTLAALCRFFRMRLTVPKIPPPPHAGGEVREPRRKPKAKAAPKRGRKKSNPVIGG